MLILPQNAHAMDCDGIWITARDIPAICELTGCHRTTVSRWLDKGELPPPVHRLLDLIYNGNLERINPAWKGWSVDRKSGELVSPLGRGMTPGEILAMPLRYQHIATLECKVRELQNQLSATKASNGCRDADMVEFDYRAS